MCPYRTRMSYDLAVLESNRGQSNDRPATSSQRESSSGNRSSSSAVTRRAPSDIASFSRKKGRRKPAPSYELRTTTRGAEAPRCYAQPEVVPQFEHL
jgi:hypothetical protein